MVPWSHGAISTSRRSSATPLCREASWASCTYRDFYVESRPVLRSLVAYICLICLMVSKGSGIKEHKKKHPLEACKTFRTVSLWSVFSSTWISCSNFCTWQSDCSNPSQVPDDCFADVHPIMSAVPLISLPLFFCWLVDVCEWSTSFRSLLPGTLDLRICLINYWYYLILPHVSMQCILFSHYHGFALAQVMEIQNS